MYRIKAAILLDPTQRPKKLYNSKVDYARSILAPGSTEMIEFDQNIPHYGTLLSSMMEWKKSVIPRNPETANGIDPNLDFFKLPNGESILKRSAEVGGDPSRMVIMATSDEVIFMSNQNQKM